MKHSSTDMVVEKDIAILTLHGQYDKDDAEDFLSIYLQIYNQIESYNFKVLINLLKFEGATPEAFKIFEERHSYIEAGRIERMAIVTEHKLVQDLLIHHGGITTPVERIEIFSNTNEAMKWLKDNNK